MTKETKKNTNYKCGVVSIVGRPNVGKSTLLNAIIGEKVTIVSKIPQTTRNQIRGIYSDERGQIIFIDTPGLHKKGDTLDKYMNKAASSSMSDADCIIYLVDTQRRIGEEEENVILKLKDVKTPIIMGLNKMDKKKGRVDEYIDCWEAAKGSSVAEMNNFMLITLSAIKEINIDKLLDVIFDYLPEGPALYPTDIISDTPKKMVISDIIREKLFRYMKQEMPHSLGVSIDEMTPIKGKKILIRATIFVEHERQKEIVVGKGGSNLKKIGKEARVDLEDLLETGVFLELFVKTQQRWRENQSLLSELGYDETMM
ncbi:MAG: GTP-binding protein Era [Lysobacterales bacterium]|jgi:GTP-binding protein Era